MTRANIFGVAGYSGTPLSKKLGIKEGGQVALIGAPKGFEGTLGRLPRDVTVTAAARKPLDLIVFFTTTRAELARRLATLARKLDPAGGLWVAWPKRSSGMETDITENVIRECMGSDLVDNKVCAIDDTWSGLRLVVRKERRAEWPPRSPSVPTTPRAGSSSPPRSP